VSVRFSVVATPYKLPVLSSRPRLVSVPPCWSCHFLRTHHALLLIFVPVLSACSLPVISWHVRGVLLFIFTEFPALLPPPPSDLRLSSVCHVLHGNEGPLSGPQFSNRPPRSQREAASSTVQYIQSLGSDSLPLLGLTWRPFLPLCHPCILPSWHKHFRYKQLSIKYSTPSCGR
jgi:hypothetical protein